MIWVIIATLVFTTLVYLDNKRLVVGRHYVRAGGNRVKILNIVNGKVSFMDYSIQTISYMPVEDFTKEYTLDE